MEWLKRLLKKKDKNEEVESIRSRLQEIMHYENHLSLYHTLYIQFLQTLETIKEHPEAVDDYISQTKDMIAMIEPQLQVMHNIENQLFRELSYAEGDKLAIHAYRLLDSMDKEAMKWVK